MESSSQGASLQDIWNQIAAGSEVTLAFSSKSEYNSMRVMLIRKFTNHKKLLEELGGSFASGQYMACSWNGKETSGSFSIRSSDDKKRKSYNVKFL